MELQDLNHWWVENRVKKTLVPSTYRNLYFKIKNELKRRQIQILIGLRRTGKSTLLFQLIDGLIKVKNINPSNILYCSFDEPDLQGKALWDIIKEYSKLADVDYKKDNLYLFLDEIQKSKDWVSNVKLIYDNFSNLKLILSGSASLNILSEAKKNLAGRAIYYELKPLSFKEFLYFKNIKIEENKLLLYKDVLEKEFGKYMLRTFPELVKETNKNFIINYVRSSVIEPIILKDIPKEFNEADILLIERLVSIFLSNPGQYLILDELAKELKRAKATLYKMMFYLEFSFLIKRVLNFRPSMRIASRKLSRIYAYHPSLCIPFNIPPEKYVENLVQFELNTDYYWREKEKEIDFIKGSSIVEVKYKSAIKRRDLRWVEYFLKKYKPLGFKKAYVITKELDERRGSISLIPLWKFCFSRLKA